MDNDILRLLEVRLTFPLLKSFLPVIISNDFWYVLTDNRCDNRRTGFSIISSSSEYSDSVTFHQIRLFKNIIIYISVVNNIVILIYSLTIILLFLV